MKGFDCEIATRSELHKINFTKDFPSEILVIFMESKIRPQYSTTNHAACMCTESAQSNRERRKGC